MSRRVLPMATRIQRLFAILQWVASEVDGVEVTEVCERFAMTEAELLKELAAFAAGCEFRL